MITEKTGAALTEDEAHAIAQAIEAVREGTKRVSEAAWDAPSRGDARNLGRLTEALDAADDVLFNVLNTAASYCNCANGAHAIEILRRKRHAASVPNEEGSAEAPPDLSGVHPSDRRVYLGE